MGVHFCYWHSSRNDYSHSYAGLSRLRIQSEPQIWIEVWFYAVSLPLCSYDPPLVFYHFMISIPLKSHTRSNKITTFHPPIICFRQFEKSVGYKSMVWSRAFHSWSWPIPSLNLWISYGCFYSKIFIVLVPQFINWVSLYDVL